MAEIKACKCKHEYQDNKYGKGKRVYNNGPKDSSDHCKSRCTVCGVQK